MPGLLLCGLWFLFTVVFQSSQKALRGQCHPDCFTCKFCLSMEKRKSQMKLLRSSVGAPQNTVKGEMQLLHICLPKLPWVLEERKPTFQSSRI